MFRVYYSFCYGQLIESYYDKNGVEVNLTVKDHLYKRCRKFSKRINNMFEYDMILIPIHLGTHWCMGALNFSAKRIE